MSRDDPALQQPDGACDRELGITEDVNVTAIITEGPMPLISA